MNSLLLLLALIPSALGLSLGEPDTSSTSKSYMSDKTEVAVDLEVSGAEALCQTDDGYVWIAQYSGLTRYDSNDFVTYKNFVEGNNEYSVLNVRALASKGNALYVATSENVFVHQDNSFSHLDVNAGTIRDIALDEVNDLLYISSYDKGATIYDLKNNTSSRLPNVGDVTINDIALDTKRNNYYYQLDSGVYDKNGKEIYLYPKIYEIYSFGDLLYIGEDNGKIHRYNMATESFLSDVIIPDQVNKMLYSEMDKTLFVACEKNGLYCVNLAGDTPVISLAGDLQNKNQLVDLMIDYEGNLWIASHFVGSSGVSIITKNALTELLYDDPTWKEVISDDRGIYAIERYGDVLYIMSVKRIYLFDLKTNKILPDNAIMKAIEEYVEGKTISYSPRDVEAHDNKLYFAVNGIGLVEYDPSNENVKIYDVDYISNHIIKTVGSVDLALTSTVRSLRSFGSYLAIGYGRGLLKFDGTNFSAIASPNNVLYFQKSKEGKLLFVRTQGIFEVDDDFSTVKEIETIKTATGNRLKFLVDGDYIYYTLNSRLFKLEEVDGKYVSTEIIIPYVKGSLVELSKIEYKNKNNVLTRKYVIASQTQIYIADTLDVAQLENYEFYDGTNGLKPIAANTSGFYDSDEQKYYFQTTNGIFAYDFNETKSTTTPVKISLASISLDGVDNYGNLINIDKNTYRVTINLAIFGFKPHKGYTVYYKMDGVDNYYHSISDNERNINYTNLPGGEYTFHAYAVDEFGQKSNEISIQLNKQKHIYEEVWFWVIVGALALGVVVGLAFLYTNFKTRKALRKQLEYKNITLESIQAIARTIDAKDEYTNGHSTRVGYYSKLIAENLGMSQDDVDNIYYIALLHDIGKIAIPDKILNKPGRLTDEEFAVMKSHTVRGAKILKGISTIPHIVEGAKYHHERYDGTGYPEGLKGEDIPFVARIICCADCFDAMASKRVYKESFSLETIVSEFKRCSGTQFDPEIAKVVVNMIETGKLKPYTVESTYLGEDGKTHRISEKDNEEDNHASN